MIGSDHDGEALSAARMAHKLVSEAGLTWDKVVGQQQTVLGGFDFGGLDRSASWAGRAQRPTTSYGDPGPIPNPNPTLWARLIAMRILKADGLTAFETTFLQNIARRTKDLSPAQWIKLNELNVKYP